MARSIYENKIKKWAKYTIRVYIHAGVLELSEWVWFGCVDSRVDSHWQCTTWRVSKELLLSLSLANQIMPSGGYHVSFLLANHILTSSMYWIVRLSICGIEPSDSKSHSFSYKYSPVWRLHFHSQVQTKWVDVKGNVFSLVDILGWHLGDFSFSFLTHRTRNILLPYSITQTWFVWSCSDLFCCEWAQTRLNLLSGI